MRKSIAAAALSRKSSLEALNWDNSLAKPQNFHTQSLPTLLSEYYKNIIQMKLVTIKCREQWPRLRVCYIHHGPASARPGGTTSKEKEISHGRVPWQSH